MANNKTIIVEGEVKAYLDSGFFAEVDGKSLCEMLEDLGVIELTDDHENTGKGKIRVTIEILD